MIYDFKSRDQPNIDSGLNNKLTATTAGTWRILFTPLYGTNWAVKIKKKKRILNREHRKKLSQVLNMF